MKTLIYVNSLNHRMSNISQICIISLHLPASLSIALDVWQQEYPSCCSFLVWITPPPSLRLPYSAGSDIMHLAVLNILDLLISLWRMTLDCTKPDNKSIWDWAVFKWVDLWKEHREAVIKTLHFLPSSFDHPLCNFAEKLTSSYKAWEFLLYLYSLGPRLLYNILPDPYYSNYCKLVFGMIG